MPLAGAGYKPDHAADVFEMRHESASLKSTRKITWAQLEALRARWSLSLHGVGLSIGGAETLDVRHLMRLRRLVDRYHPALFSEHLARSTHHGVFLNDLLPLPYTPETLQRAATISTMPKKPYAFECC